MSQATCRSCGAAITWARTEAGKLIPIDEKPVPNGNIDLIGAPPVAEDKTPRALMLDSGGARREGEFVVRPFDRYQSHFASCAFADAHRKPKEGDHA